MEKTTILIPQELIKDRGEYDTLTLVEGSALDYFSADTTQYLKKVIPTPQKSFSSFISGMFGDKNDQELRHNSVLLADLIALRGIVGTNDIEFLNNGVASRDLEMYAHVMLRMLLFRDLAYTECIKGGDRDNTKVGLILSDFLDILPDEVAALIIVAGFDKDLLENTAIKNGIRQPIDEVRSRVLEAFVLQSHARKLKLLDCMSKIAPNTQVGSMFPVVGTTQAILNGLIGNIWNKKSPYCIVEILQRNLGENYLDKMNEFVDHIDEYNAVIRSNLRKISA